MDFVNEEEMHPYLVNSLFEPIIEDKNDYCLIGKKITDVVLCKNGNDPKLFFFELKCFSRRNNRLNIGNGRGKGNQIEILTKRPDYFEINLRWILANPTINESEKIYLFLTNQEILENISGGSIGNKHNNIRLSIFDQYTLYNINQLRDQIETFINE